MWRLAGSLDRAELVNRRAEVLRAPEARSRRIVDTAYDAFVAADAAERITSWNEAAEDLFGYTAAEALGRDVTHTILPERLRDAHRRAFARAVERVRPGGPPARRTLETTARHRDGHEIPVELIVASAHEEGGVMFHAFVRDITERRRANEELRAAQVEVLHRLALAAEYRDDDTGEHAKRVGELSARLATRVGLAADEVELLRRAAPLHDVGKIGVPDSILLKRGPLTAAEFDEVKTHTLIGADMLAGGGFPLLELAERIALTHHERWDGSGYPRGIAGEAIPLVGRIVALADVFDALTNDRPYKAAWSVAAALEEIELQRGREFDPALTDAFLKMIRADEPPAAPAAALQVAG